MSAHILTLVERVREGLRELRKVEHGATAGPWTMDESRYHAQNQLAASASVEEMSHGGMVATATITAWKQGHKDARPDCRFIALSRTALPQLLAFAEGRLERAIKLIQDIERLYSQEVRQPSDMVVLGEAKQEILDLAKALGIEE